MTNDVELSNMTDMELYQFCVQSQVLTPLENELMHRLEDKMTSGEPDDPAWPEWMHEMIDESAGEQLPLFPDL